MAGARPPRYNALVVVRHACIAMLFVLAGCEGRGVLTEGDYYGQEGEGEGGTPGQVGPGAGRGVTVTIDSPADGSIVRSRPVRVTGTALGAGHVSVNGAEVEVSDDGGFRAELRLEEGPQAIVASAAGAEDAAIRVVVDTVAPTIRIDEPARGLFHAPETDGPLVTVRGQITDAGTGVVAALLDGEPLELDPKGGFSAEVAPPEGLSTIEILATDGAERTGNALRSMISGRYAPPSEPADRAIHARIDAATLAVVTDMAQSFIQDGALAGLAGAASGDDFEVLQFRYDSISLELQPDHGGFRTRIRVHGLYIEVKVRQKILFATVTLTGDVDVDETVLDVFLVPQVTPDGSLDIIIRDPSVALNGFSFDINNFPDFLEGWLEGTVRGVVEGALEGELNNRVIPRLFDPESLRQQIDLLGTPLTVMVRLQELTVDPGGVSIVAALQAEAPPGEGMPAAPGALVTGNGGGGAGLDIGQAPIRASVTDDAANRIAHVVWAAGALRLAQGIPEGGAVPLSFTVESLSSMFRASFDEVASAEAPVEFAVDFLLPPVITPADPGVPAPVDVSIGDMLLTFQAATEAGPVPLLTVALALDVSLDISAADGSLALGMVLGARADTVGGAVPVDDEYVETNTTRLLGLLGPALPELLGEQPLPEFSGIALSDLLLGSTGADLWLGITLSLGP